MKFIKKRIDRHYHPKNKNWHFHLVADSILAIAIIALIATNFYISSIDSGEVLGTQNDGNINGNQNTNTSDDNSDDTATTTDDDTGDTDDQVIIKPVVIPTTNIEFQSFARYYTAEGEQLGMGPIPPIAGISTRYWIFMSLDGFTHDLENIVVSAKIPRNVSLTGKSSITQGENISFDVSTGTISWKIDKLLAAEDLQTIGAAFEVEIVPLPAQIGTSATLLSEVSILATDTVARAQISKNNPEITTNLSAGGAGIVEAQ